MDNKTLQANPELLKVFISNHIPHTCHKRLFDYLITSRQKPVPYYNSHLQNLSILLIQVQQYYNPCTPRFTTGFYTMIQELKSDHVENKTTGNKNIAGMNYILLKISLSAVVGALLDFDRLLQIENLIKTQQLPKKIYSLNAFSGIFGTLLVVQLNVRYLRNIKHDSDFEPLQGCFGEFLCISNTKFYG